MEIKEIRDILESPYDRNVWKKFIQTQFTNNKLYGSEQELKLSDKSLSKQCVSLGNYEVDEYTKIGIFEIELKDNVNITRNRVALRNLIKDITQQVSGAMVVFVQGDKWRFSYISKRKVKNRETNEIEDKETAPKRYTYLFGKNEKALTAAIRFDKLIQKQKENAFEFLTLNDFEDAFSVEKLSKEFFKIYKDTYEDFVQFLTGKRYKKSGNKYVEQVIQESDWQLGTLFNRDEKQARDFCKRMMGRIVFLYFIQKKGWLAVAKGKEWGKGNPDYIYDLFRKSKNQEDFYSKELVSLFFTTLNNPDSENEDNSFRFPYLNGGLFDDNQDKQYNTLKLPSAIFSRLFETFNNYNFTIYEDLPDEHTVAVDPEMLGHIFENLLEDNKDKGAFYTPKEIVHYMCQESLKEYLSSEKLSIVNDESDIDIIDKILTQSELNTNEKQFAERYAYKIIDALDNVKICDPAIGSGAFPMGILQEIFNAQIYLQEIKGFKKGVSDADIKKHIIQESVYGVDIDSGAVDIARLRFWLSLIVDENTPQPLPNLDFKIMTGNSLLSRYKLEDPIDIVFKDLNDDRKKKGLETISIKEYKKLMQDYLNTSDKSSKTEYKTLINEIKNAFFISLDNKQIGKVAEARGKYENLLGTDIFNNKKATVTQIKKAKEQFEKLEKEANEIKSGAIFRNSMEWRFEFPTVLNEKGDFEGFDIVIGNPPYVQLQNNNGVLAKMFENCGYETFEGGGDIYALFYELGIKILKPDGILTFITSNKWMKASYGKSLRKFFADYNPITLIDLGPGVFENATVDTNILIIQKQENKQKTLACVIKEKVLNNLSVFVRQNSEMDAFISSDSWIILSPIEKQIKRKIELIGTPLKDWDININYGIKTGFNDAFIITGEQRKKLVEQDPKSAEIIRPILRGRDIKRYGYEFADLWLINSHNGIKEKAIKPIEIDNYPAIKKHLSNYESQLEKRTDKGDTPYNLRNCAYMEDFDRQKIIWIELADKGRFAFDAEDKYLTLNGTFIMIGSDLEFLCCILNNPISSWHFNTFCISSGVGTNQWRELYVKDLYIPKIPKEKQQPLINLFRQIISLGKQKKSTIQKQKELNFMVYELVQLDEEEIKFIEAQ